MISVSAYTSIVKKRMQSKAREGRGLQFAQWLQALEKDLVGDFERFRRLGIMISSGVLRMTTKILITTSKNHIYNYRTVDDRISRLISSQVDY